MTGSIAGFKACALISKLVQAGHHVKVVASASALQFVGPATIEGLTGEKVVSDLWEKGEAMAHIHLMRWADAVAVVPASAHFINRIAQGIGDDLLTTMFLAHDFKKPYMIAPAMNTSMYLHPVTQKSIQSLKSMGIEILEAASGVLACGEVGYGRLLEPDLLQKEIESRLETVSAASSAALSASSPLKVLITSGGTQEPLDRVRVISNISTGSTGAEIADRLESFGLSVVLLHAEDAELPQSDCEKISFRSSADLTARLAERLGQGDIFAVLHLAAISDFVLESWEQNGASHPAGSRGKISSASDLSLKLKRNPKILPLIREMSPRPLHLTAFKMTAGADAELARQAVNRVFEQGRPDWVVHNDLDWIDAKKNAHRMRLYRSRGEDALALDSRAALVDQLVENYSSLLQKEQGRTR
jgi:phosphopantothenoylcysteine decarboxylase/phosphopantothenate--cysteine ligase